MTMIQRVNRSLDNRTTTPDSSLTSIVPAKQEPAVKTESVPHDFGRTENTPPFPLPPLPPAAKDTNGTPINVQGYDSQANTVDLNSDIKTENENAPLIERGDDVLEVTKLDLSENPARNMCPVCSQCFDDLELFIQHLAVRRCVKLETEDVNASLTAVGEDLIAGQDDFPLDIDNNTSLHVFNELVRAYLNPTFEESNSDPENRERPEVHISSMSGTSHFTDIQDQIRQNGAHATCGTEQQALRCTHTTSSPRSDSSIQSAASKRQITPEECRLCPRTFPTQESFLRQQVSHASAAETTFQCPTCSFTTTSKASLVRHRRLHTGEKPFKCTLCPYAGAQHQRLVEHLRTHSGEKPYACSLCAFTATTKKGVTRHMKTHTGEKPFKCSLCAFASSQRASLNRHFRRHTGEKPYKCSTCPYAASELKILVCHQRTHTGEKPFKCSLCSYASTKQCNLVRHMGIHSTETVTMVDNPALSRDNSHNLN